MDFALIFSAQLAPGLGSGLKLLRTKISCLHSFNLLHIYPYTNFTILDKERIIWEFVEFTPVMNKRQDEECMAIFLDKVIVNGVQDPDLTPFKEFLPRSAPLVDFLSIGIHSRAGWKYLLADTIHGIQARIWFKDLVQ